MGEMADLHADMYYAREYDFEGNFHDECVSHNDYEVLAKLDTEFLIALSVVYQEEGYIDEDDFPVKMVNFYNSRGFLTTKQRASLLDSLTSLPTDERTDEMISLHLSEMKEEKEHQRLVQSLQKPYEPPTEKKI